MLRTCQLTISQQYKKTMGDKFEMHCAFSREGPNKVYVQHLLKEQGKMINDLLEQKAYFYVCGDAANMAREVNAVLVQIIAQYRDKSEAKAEEIVKNMRAANQYQVRTYQSTKPCKRLQSNPMPTTGGRLVIEGTLSFLVLICYQAKRNWRGNNSDTVCVHRCFWYTGVWGVGATARAIEIH